MAKKRKCSDRKIFDVSGKFWNFHAMYHKNFEQMTPSWVQIPLLPVLDIHWDSFLSCQVYAKDGTIYNPKKYYKTWVFFIQFKIFNLETQFTISSYPTFDWSCKHIGYDEEKYYKYIDYKEEDE